jgi:hypothetical protein
MLEGVFCKEDMLCHLREEEEPIDKPLSALRGAD